MNPRDPISPTDINAFEFDGTEVLGLPIDPDADAAPFQRVFERGSDEHIAFLERVVAEMQATLDTLREQRDRARCESKA